MKKLIFALTTILFISYYSYAQIYYVATGSVEPANATAIIDIKLNGMYDNITLSFYSDNPGVIDSIVAGSPTDTIKGSVPNDVYNDGTVIEFCQLKLYDELNDVSLRCLKADNITQTGSGLFSKIYQVKGDPCITRFIVWYFGSSANTLTWSVKARKIE